MKKMVMMVMVAAMVMMMAIPVMAFDRGKAGDAILKMAFSEWTDDIECVIYTKKNCSQYRVETETENFKIVMWMTSDNCYGNIYDLDGEYLTSWDNDDWYEVSSYTSFTTSEN